MSACSIPRRNIVRIMCELTSLSFISDCIPVKHCENEKINVLIIAIIKLDTLFQIAHLYDLNIVKSTTVAHRNVLI